MALENVFNSGIIGRFGLEYWKCCQFICDSIYRIRCGLSDNAELIDRGQFMGDFCVERGDGKTSHRIDLCIWSDRNGRMRFDHCRSHRSLIGDLRSLDLHIMPYILVSFLCSYSIRTHTAAKRDGAMMLVTF